MASRLILGSQSPQRRRLLQSLAGSLDVIVMPPANDDEPGFDGLYSVTGIEQRLHEIVQLKTDDVRQQLQPELKQSAYVICADTIVVCRSTDGSPLVLGKPPARNWQPTVTDWFRNLYSGRTHEVWTAFQVSGAEQTEMETVKATVQFPEIDDHWIDWYLQTEEPIGKAGGYGIQGHAAAFVSSIEGSLTTIIGLPVFELGQCLKRFGVL